MKAVEAWFCFWRSASVFRFSSESGSGLGKPGTRPRCCCRRCCRCFCWCGRFPGRSKNTSAFAHFGPQPPVLFGSTTGMAETQIQLCDRDCGMPRCYFKRAPRLLHTHGTHLALSSAGFTLPALHFLGWIQLVYLVLPNSRQTHAWELCSHFLSLIKTICKVAFKLKKQNKQKKSLQLWEQLQKPVFFLLFVCLVFVFDDQRYNIHYTKWLPCKHATNCRYFWPAQVNVSKYCSLWLMCTHTDFYLLLFPKIHSLHGISQSC